METVVYGIISEVFGVDAHEVNPETEFHQDHSANREATQRLQHQLNDQYVIQMSDEELVQIKTVHDAISQIKGMHLRDLSVIKRKHLHPIWKIQSTESLPMFWG
ncbi:MAG: hypothetical protein IPP17_17685 [Bacteroidetes bacterium]|nr:hypothetical protein [Bacteroidota bacterium]